MATFNKVTFANASPKGGGDNRLNSIPAKAKHVNDLIDSLQTGDNTYAGNNTFSGTTTGTGAGVTYTATSGVVSIPVAAQANAYTIALPANALILDLGILCISAIGGGSNSGTVAVKFGTAANGAQLVASATICDSNSATAAGSFMSVLNAVEMDASGAAFADFVDGATMWGAAARNVHITVTQGSGVAAAVGKAHFTCLYTILAA